MHGAGKRARNKNKKIKSDLVCWGELESTQHEPDSGHDHQLSHQSLRSKSRKSQKRGGVRFAFEEGKVRSNGVLRWCKVHGLEHGQARGQRGGITKPWLD